METHHAETVVEKTINFVKDVLGIQHGAPPDVIANPEYHDLEEKELAENAMSLDPNGYEINSAGVVTPGSLLADTPPLPMSDTERLRREVDEHPSERTTQEFSADVVRRENGI